MRVIRQQNILLPNVDISKLQLVKQQHNLKGANLSKLSLFQLKQEILKLPKCLTLAKWSATP